MFYAGFYTLRFPFLHNILSIFFSPVSPVICNVCLAAESARLQAHSLFFSLAYLLQRQMTVCVLLSQPEIHIVLQGVDHTHAENYQVRVWSHSFLRHMCVNWLKKERWSFLIGVMCLQRKYLTHGEKKRRRLRNEFDLPVSCFVIWLVRTQTDLWFLPI